MTVSRLVSRQSWLGSLPLDTGHTRNVKWPPWLAVTCHMVTSLMSLCSVVLPADLHRDVDHAPHLVLAHDLPRGVLPLHYITISYCYYMWKYL